MNAFSSALATRTSLFGILLTFLVPSLRAQVSGRIIGSVADAETGETLIGANVLLSGTMIGATTDLDGFYEIARLESGTYSIVFSYIGFISETVNDVVIKAGETTHLNVSLTSSAIDVGEVLVEARVVREGDAIVLRDRQKALAISDVVSAETISRAGSATAADAMKKVTGVSVQGGKYVYIRGLGDRYMNTRLNGAELPSSDPERNAVSFDLFPAGMLGNIVTTKTFTPDMPGNFTGGSVNISTRDYPEVFTLSVSSSLSYNANLGLGGDYLSYRGGTAGVFGNNGGTHRLPAILKDAELRIPSVGEAFTDATKARELDRISRAFGNTMSPSLLSAPANQSYGISLGDKFRLFNRPLGVVSGLSYNRHRTGYEGGTSARYQLTGSVQDVDGLNNDFRFNDMSGSDEVLWGGLVNLSYKLHPRHEIGLNYLYNKTAESTARFQSGTFPRDLSTEAVYETRVLKYVEREMRSIQGRGEHVLKGMKIKWNTTYTSSTRNEPDLRYFTDNFSIFERGGRIDTFYTVQASIYPVPTRYFRDLKDDSWMSNLDITIPFRAWNGQRASAKIGTSHSRKNRTFRERRFEFRTDSRVAGYSGDPAAFFNDENVGIIEDQSTDRFFRFGNYVIDASQASNNYVGDQSISAAYAMIEWPIFRSLRFVGGLRFETTSITVLSADTTLTRGQLDDRDWLPSANLIFQLADDMNLRLVYGRTLARPVFRELAPYASFNFVGDYVFIGNSELKRTLVDNLDLRWEWFTRPGEILAVSGFYKAFYNPIERAINPIAAASNPEVQFRNVDRASVIGLELEVRKKLGGVFRGLQIGGNMSRVESRVDIAADELALVRAFDSNASSSRPLMGQSPFTINVDVTYDNLRTGTTVSIFYNVFGKRLDKVSMGGTPDIYEKPQNIVDLTFKQQIWRTVNLRFSAKNLLDARFRLAHDFKGREYITQEYRLGRSFSLGLSISP